MNRTIEVAGGASAVEHAAGAGARAAGSGWRRPLVMAGCVAAGAAGLWFGYDFGDRLAGPWVGVVAALNCGALATLLADALLSRGLLGER